MKGETMFHLNNFITNPGYSGARINFGTEQGLEMVKMTPFVRNGTGALLLELRLYSTTYDRDVALTFSHPNEVDDLINQLETLKTLMWKEKQR